MFVLRNQLIRLIIDRSAPWQHENLLLQTFLNITLLQEAKYLAIESIQRVLDNFELSLCDQGDVRGRISFTQNIVAFLIEPMHFEGILHFMERLI